MPADPLQSTDAGDEGPVAAPVGAPSSEGEDVPHHSGAGAMLENESESNVACLLAL